MRRAPTANDARFLARSGFAVNTISGSQISPTSGSGDVTTLTCSVPRAIRSGAVTIWSGAASVPHIGQQGSLSLASSTTAKSACSMLLYVSSVPECSTVVHVRSDGWLCMPMNYCEAGAKTAAAQIVGISPRSMTCQPTRSPSLTIDLSILRARANGDTSGSSGFAR